VSDEAPRAVPPDAAPPVEAAPATPAARRYAWRGLKGTVKAVLLWLLLFYVVVPQLAGARRALDVLSQIEPGWLLLGGALQILALLSYSRLTAVAIPARHQLPLHKLLRIQLATKAVSNIVPGGSAAGSALGYRLLTSAGVPGSYAGFALATSGLFSAVVLNAMLLGALLVTIPYRGVNPAYLTAAVIGVTLLVFAAVVVVGLLRGRRQMVTVVRAVARKVRMSEERAAALVHRLVDRIAEIGRDPRLLRRATLWATLNWVLDAASLWVFLRAFGVSAPPDGLLVAFCLANVSAVIPLTPGGLGVIEAVLSSTLVGFGLDRGTATIGVLTYRLAQFWLPIPLGGLAYLSLRVGRRPAAEALETEEDRITWAERYGTRPAAGPPR
jgi:uncharacterized protein (TIRG00374 family)